MSQCHSKKNLMKEVRGSQRTTGYDTREATGELQGSGWGQRPEPEQISWAGWAGHMIGEMIFEGNVCDPGKSVSC